MTALYVFFGLYFLVGLGVFLGSRNYSPERGYFIPQRGRFFEALFWPTHLGNLIVTASNYCWTMLLILRDSKASPDDMLRVVSEIGQKVDSMEKILSKIAEQKGLNEST